ncbi:hypothetical protein WN944_014290 [Citrus x changshan-huyou]|uniref:HAT C-terminal dimerisation domain-containing protein n=1 Tax=Citrus x changshan-huyou TaxID=2935761 RepID=A0AAP0M5F2_9ROSI
MDMVEEHLGGKPEFKEVTRMVRKAGGRQGSSLPPRRNVANYLKQALTCRRKVLLFFYRSSQRITDENRSALLVVAILIATATFQAALTPADDLEGNKSTGTPNSIATNGSHSPSTSASTWTSVWASVTRSGTANATATTLSNGTSSSIPRSDKILFAAGQFYGEAISDMISILFAFSNITAFFISMLVINYHLPYGSAATLGWQKSPQGRVLSGIFPIRGGYPTLARIAIDILAIPITTVASESAFSTDGRVVSPHRNKLNPSTLEALMCCQSWLRAYNSSLKSEAISQFATFLEEEQEEQDEQEDYED